MRPPLTLISRLFQFLSNRQFAEAERVLKGIEAQMPDTEWSRGYLHALNGIIITYRSDDRYAFLHNIDLKDKDEVKRNYREFMKHSRNRLHTDYDRGFFSAWADFMKVLMKTNLEVKRSKRSKGIKEG